MTRKSSTDPVGIRFRETMTGPFALGETDPVSGEAAGRAANTTLALHASIEIADLDRFVSDAGHAGAISGQVDFAPLGMDMPGPGGTFRLFAPTDREGVTRMVYELGFEHDGTPYYLAGHKKVQNDKHGTDLFDDTTTLHTVLHGGTDATGPVLGAGVLRLGLPDLLRLSSTLRVINAADLADQTRALATFGRFFMGNLWETYGPKPHA